MVKAKIKKFIQSMYFMFSCKTFKQSVSFSQILIGLITFIKKQKNQPINIIFYFNLLFFQKTFFL